jgi:hypothetical protein
MCRCARDGASVDRSDVRVARRARWACGQRGCVVRAGTAVAREESGRDAVRREREWTAVFGNVPASGFALLAFGHELHASMGFNMAHIGSFWSTSAHRDDHRGRVRKLERRCAMLRKVALVLGVAVVLAASALVGEKASASNGFGNNCNAAVTKAVGKKMACELGLYAQAQKKGVPVDAMKLASCGTKFSAACSKANQKGGCDTAHADCAGKETAADSCAASLSPSGAFLD